MLIGDGEHGLCVVRGDGNGTISVVVVLLDAVELAHTFEGTGFK